MSLMLSQRIAKSVHFLRGHNNSWSQEQLFKLRLQIVHAQKLVVGRELLNYNEPMDEMRDRIYGSVDGVADKVARQIDLCRDHVRCPWPTLFVESDQGAFLVREVIQDDLKLWVVTTLEMGGVVHPNTYYYSWTQAHGFQMGAADSSYVPITEDGEDKNYFGMASAAAVILMRVLTFLNTKNVTVHHYTPTKRENEAVPKPLLPYYSYRVLDIFRDKKVYQSMADVRDFLPSVASAERRAHLVRGHFKNTRHGIFWWSMHLRSRKNLDTLGFADKDYRLVA